MQLSDVESCLDIKIPTDKTTVYEKRLAVAIGQAIKYCSNDFKNSDGIVEIPDGAQMGIALMVKSMGEAQNVASQSLGDMAKSFFQNGTSGAAKSHLKPFRKVKYI